MKRLRYQSSASDGGRTSNSAHCACPNYPPETCARHWKFGNIVKIGSNLTKWFDEPLADYGRGIDLLGNLQILINLSRYEILLPPADYRGQNGEEY